MKENINHINYVIKVISFLIKTSASEQVSRWFLNTDFFRLDNTKWCLIT